MVWVLAVWLWVSVVVCWVVRSSLMPSMMVSKMPTRKDMKMEVAVTTAAVVNNCYMLGRPSELVYGEQLVFDLPTAPFRNLKCDRRMCCSPSVLIPLNDPQPCLTASSKNIPQPHLSTPDLHISYPLHTSMPSLAQPQPSHRP